MLTIDKETCIQCETCVAECPNGCLSLEGEEIMHDGSRCNMCGHCLAVCPSDAIMIDGDGYDCMDVEELSFAKKLQAAELRNMILIRRSVRRFSDTEVTDKEIDAILEAGKYAPTAKNVQGNAFMVITDYDKKKEMLEDMSKILLNKGKALADKIPGLAAFFVNKASKYIEQGRDEIFYDAPVVIFVFADNDIDGAICASTMGFMAQAQQLGYCYAQLPTDAFADEEFAKKWKAFEGKKCVLALLIGNEEPEYFCSVPRKNPPVIRY